MDILIGTYMWNSHIFFKFNPERVSIIVSFRDYKLAFATKFLTVPPMLSQGLFQCDVAKKFHSTAR